MSMLKSHQEIISVAKDIIEKNINEHQLSECIQNIVSHVQRQPFLYSYLRDLIVAIRSSDTVKDKKLMSLLSTLIDRLEYFHYWQIDNNSTIKLIERNIIKTDEIKPHIRLSDSKYEEFYAQQNANLGKRINKNKRSIFKYFKSYSHINFNHYDHSIRKTHALNTIETYMAILEKLDVDINKKWLDIGCGTGQIANAVYPKRHAKSHWRIEGCDLQKNRILVANNNACRKRHFFRENVLNKLQKNNFKDNEFDIISMFEFCEHFADPFSLLKNISKFNFKLMVIATPLEQKLNAVNDSTPDPVHLWSFTAKAIIKMLEELNLKVIFHSETTVGTYTKGLDWLTVVATKPDIYSLFQLK